MIVRPDLDRLDCIALVAVLGILTVAQLVAGVSGTPWSIWTLVSFVGSFVSARFAWIFARAVWLDIRTAARLAELLHDRKANP